MKNNIALLLGFIISVSYPVNLFAENNIETYEKSISYNYLDLSNINDEIIEIQFKIKSDIDKLLNQYNILISSIIINQTDIEPVTESTTQQVIKSSEQQITESKNIEKNKYSNVIYEVFQLTNDERAKNGLSLLELDDNLMKSAQEHAEDMYNNDYFSHTSLDEKTLSDRILKYGEEFSYMGENIAKGQNSSKDVIEAWMSSQGHRKNILNSNYKKLGIGYCNNYWVQNFGG